MKGFFKISNFIIDENKIADDLNLLTDKLSRLGLQTSDGLGGPTGYGTYFENEVFGMHPYCWCDQNDCAWCAGCTCDDGVYSFYSKEGIEVSLENYLTNISDNYLLKDEKLICDYCKGVVVVAPNFWHKKSNSWILV